MASPLYDIDNLDDLYNAYYDGLIDYGTFRTVYDAYMLGGLSRDDLRALALFDKTELNFISLYADTLSFWGRLLAADKTKIGMERNSGNFENIQSEYYAYGVVDRYKSAIVFNDDNGQYQFSRRMLAYDDNIISVALGDYLAREGYGLAIGSYDYRPSSGFDDSQGVDILYPDNNYYNGTKLSVVSGRFAGRFYYSKKKYNESDKQFIGAGGDITSDIFTGGISFGYNDFRSGSVNDDKLALGINGQLISDVYLLSGEYAVIEKSAGAYISGARYFSAFEVETEFWHYSDQFYNYNCSAPSASDYDEFYPGDDSLGFKSCQAGETGLAINYQTAAISSGLQLWNHSYDEHLNSAIHWNYSYVLNEQLKTKFQASYRNTDDDEYFWFKAAFISNLIPLSKLGIKLYSEKGGLVNDEGYAFSDFSFAVSDHIDWLIRLRTYFDGQLYWYIGESYTATWGLNLRAEVSHKNTTRINLKVEKIL